jgi:hypothetical protein
MKQRAAPALLYLLAALALARYFDSLYGAAPVVRRLEAVHAGIAGTILLAVACLLSLFSLRLGGVCGLVAGLLVWPYFGPILVSFPWSRVFEVLPYAMWADSLAALVMLTIASIYSMARLWLWFRAGLVASEAHPPM